MPWYNLFGPHNVPLKVGDLDMCKYDIGDPVDGVPDGTYIDPKTGVVAIYNGQVVATYGPDQVYNQYGEKLAVA